MTNNTKNKVIIERINNTIINKCVKKCLRKYLNEQINRVSLNENAQDRRVNNLIKQYYPTADFNEIRKIRADFLNIIPNARARNEKWLCIVLKWYLDGDIPHEEYKRLNNYLGWLHNNTDTDNDFEGDWKLFPFRWVKQHYDRLFPRVHSDTTKNNKKQLNDKTQQINGYTIRRVDSQEEASKLAYSVYHGEWCILDNLFKEQVDDCTCYIISNNKTYNRCKPMQVNSVAKQLKKMGHIDIAHEINGARDVKDIADCSEEYFEIAYIDNCLPPYDKYGLSAIVILVGEDGGFYGVYSRYNLPNMFDGCILDKMELSQLLGVDIDTVCPYVSR